MSLSVSDLLTPIEIGTLVSSVLYGVMCTQAYTYYILRRDKDNITVKMLVATVLFLETVHLVFTFIHLHRVTIQSFDDIRALDRVSWPFASNFSVMSLMDALVQTFYAYRLRTLSGQWWTIVPLAVLIPARVVDGVYVTVQMMLVGSMRQFGTNDGFLCILNLALKLSVDLYLTVGLCWYLSQWRTKGTRQTREIVDKLVVWTAEVGLLSSICAVALLLMILTMDNMIWTALVVIYPRIISNSLLAMLNGRPAVSRSVQWCDDDDQSTTANAVSAISFAPVVRSPLEPDRRRK